MILFKLLKSQLNESRVKCELLEQSLRVLAQENHDMETKKLHHDKHASGHASQVQDVDFPDVNNVKRSSADDETEAQWYTGNKESSENESEEFFDIGNLRD